jgi:uncharacterized protein YcbX
VKPVHVASLWRYPVKSMGGERVAALTLEGDGVVGDRDWGVRDVDAGVVLTAKGCPPLLQACASFGDGTVMVVLPDGRSGRAGSTALDDDLSDWLGRRIALEPARPGVAAGYDAGFTGPPGRFVDGWPVHLVTTATLAGDDARRYRPNVVVAAEGKPFLEDGWIDRTVALGEAQLDVRKGCTRCVMVTRRQPGLPEDRSRLRRLGRREGKLGVYLRVATPGPFREGDEVRVS